MGAAVLGIAMAAGCAAQTSSGVGGGGGQGTTSSAIASTGTTSTTASSTSASTTSTGAGGTGGAATTTSSSSSSTTSTTSTTSSSSSSTTGTGGMGGGFEYPVGTADYPAEVEQNNLKSTANPLAMGTKGFTASIYPEGDVDVFSFTVTQGGTSATISTTNGMGGCPAGAETYVRVFDSSNSVLANNTFPITGCALLAPAAYPSLAGLAAGTYYVHVESGNISAIPFYILDIKLSAPGCGDGIVQVAGGEQCDDGNMVAGDGCSPTCQLEGGPYLNETEPNDTQGTGNLLDGYVGAVGQINPLGDLDYYTFNVTTAGSSVTAEVSDGHGGCPAGFDSKIYLYSPSKVQLVANDDGPVPPCSKIDPAVDPGATNLPVGLYAIEVQRYGNSATAPFYVLKVKVSAPGCGDGILQTGEQCDDGNNVSGDGCSATCHFEKNYVPETEPNDTQALANPLPAGADGFISSINPVGDLDYYSFNVVTAGSSVTITTGDGLSGCPAGFDSKIYLYDPTHTEIANNDDGPVPPCSQISPASNATAANLAVGTYTVRVERYGNTATQAQYVVTIKVSVPGCGDGILQTGEQCDDGNNTSGDGCSATCQAEAPYEIEKNDSTATANPLWAGTSLWKGAINPVGDHDYFTFTLTAIGSPTLLTHNVNDVANCSFDTVIHLLDHTGAQIVQDDDGGPSSCSQISPALYPQVHNLPAGVYYVWVQRYMDSMSIPAYQLDLSIQ